MGVDLQEVLETSSETSTQEDDPIFTHIIDRGDDPRSVQAILLEARIYGTPVTAICGYTWIPSRDPEKHPLCTKCEEIFPVVQAFRGV